MPRTDAPPRRLLSMTWRDVLFAHWPVAPRTIARTLPNGLAVDVDDDGRAWLSVVGFVMADIRPRFSPLGLGFHELNLRTYVRHGDSAGVYFYNLDADDRLSVLVARRLFRLPYYRARMRVDDRDGAIRFRSHRVHDGVPPADFDATIEPRGRVEPVDPDSEASFLVERYRFFASDEAGRVYYGDIDHAPWSLQRADLTVRENTLFEASGFDRPESEPLVHFCRELPVTAGRLHRV